MACSESGGSKVVLCLGFFVVVISFCHCASLTRLKALDKFPESSTLNQGQTKGNGLRHGRLLIGQNSLQAAKLKRTTSTKDLLEVDSDYQADMDWGRPKQRTVWGDDLSRLNPDSTAVGRLLKMEPKVECTGDSMQLQVSNAVYTPGSLFFVDRGSRLSPLPLSKLPPSCGYTIRSTRRDLVLVAPYDGCFVTLEEDSYVLPLRWCGLTVRMSCPFMRQSSPNPPMVTCHAEGMVVKTEWTVSVSKINVKLNGRWEPLMKTSSNCGFGVVVHPEGLVISVHYAPCLEKKDGMYTLELTGDGETKISCPSLSPAQPEPTKRPLKSPDLKPQSPYQTLKPQPSAVPQSPGLPQTPGKPDQVPKVVPQPQFPHPYFYPNFFYHYFSNPDVKHMPTVQPIPTTSPATKTTTVKTQEPYYPFPFYVQLPQPGALPTQPPVTRPPVRIAAGQPQGQPKPSYPFVFYPQPPVVKLPKPEQPPEQPVPPKPLFLKKPHRQLHHPFYPGPFYPGILPYDGYQMPIPLRQQTFTPAPLRQAPPQPEATQGPSTYTQEPQQFPTPASDGKNIQPILQSSSGGVVSKDFPRMPPVYCPTVCPSGFSNCCPQINFYQYLHIVPPGLGSKHSGFGGSLAFAHPHQKPAEPRTMQVTSTSAPTVLQSQAPGNEHQYLQPPDGIHAAQPRSNPGSPPNPELPLDLYDFYSNGLYVAQNEDLDLPQSQIQALNVPPRPPGLQGNDAFNHMVQFDPFNVQPPKQQIDQLHETMPYIVSDFDQNQQEQDEHTTWELRPSNSQPSESPVFDPFEVPYNLVPEPRAPIYNNSVDPNSLQQSVTTSEEFTKPKLSMNPYSEPKGYLLLQRGPPGREPNGWKESQLSFRELIHDPTFLEHNLARQYSNEPQHPRSSPQEQYQQPKWVGNGIFSPFTGNVNYPPRSGDELGLPLIVPSSDGSRFVPLPQNPSTSAGHLKLNFPELLEDLRKPLHIPEHFNHGTLQLNTK